MRTMFEPNLVLTREPDGQFTLHAVTATPNSCYGAGRAERGIPPTVRLMPEAESVLLHITHHGGRCLQVMKPVRHHLPDLDLGPSHGKTTLIAFAMIDDRIVGSATLDVSNLGGVVPGPGKDTPLPLDTSDWYAWMNLMPPGPRSLHVTGVVTVGNPGYEVKLTEAVPQGMNPKDLILDLVLTRKPGIWPQVVTQMPVSFVKPSPSVDYDSVLVRLADGSGIPIRVEKAH
ncbi:Hypothetical protein A7982_01517 [Minicystis rosea]|nr:Hypothetical protein A7982_01517 [Minicystis rosea]